MWKKKFKLKIDFWKKNWNWNENIEETCLVWEFDSLEKNLIISLMDVFIETLDDYETVSQVLLKNYVFLL